MSDERKRKPNAIDLLFAEREQRAAAAREAAQARAQNGRGSSLPSSQTLNSTPIADVSDKRRTAWLAKMLDRAVERLSSATEGIRNDELNVVSYTMGGIVHLGLDERAARDTLEAVALSIGLTSSETERTLQSGFSAGVAEPMTIELAERKLSTPLDRPGGDSPHRELRLTPASSLTVRPVRWLWAARIALGTLVLLGGREGVGKSTIAYTLAADVTRGRLPGRYVGKPKAVIVAATEDSWEHTIVPRLIAAGADLDLVFRIDVTTVLGVETSVSLPRDLPATAEAIRDVDAALLLLDPLISRLDAQLDTHKDADVRLALEPLVTLASQRDIAVLGVIHVNKSSQSDPLTLLMGSRAFAAVARAVLFVMRAPDDDELRLLGQPKNNLGRSDLPTLTFSIVSAKVADTDEGPVWTSRVVWNGERPQSIADALAAASEDAETRTATDEAADWLDDHLSTQGGIDDSAAIKRKGRAAGHSESALSRARKRMRIVSEVVPNSFPRRTTWALRDSQPTVVSASGESETTDMTDMTVQSFQSFQSDQTPRASDTTDEYDADDEKGST